MLTSHRAKNSGYGHQKPDYTKLFDADQKPILCTQCGVSSGNTRQMLKCDFCHAYWHLDCLDPPQANPPYIGIEATHRDAWRCPRHLEHDLRSGLLHQNDLNHQDNDVEMADAAPVARIARKLRKPKNPEVIEPTFTRGMRNNGLIEVINDPDDDTDGEGNYVFGQDDSKDLNSKIFRVPEKGVILDFVTKVKRLVHHKHQSKLVSSANAIYSGRVMKNQTLKAAKISAQRDMQTFFARPVQQQQAALNLARLANHEKDVDLGDGSINALLLRLTVRPLSLPRYQWFDLSTLIHVKQSEAPDTVVTAMDNAAPPPVLAGERAQLLKLQELIARRLNG